MQQKQAKIMQGAEIFSTKHKYSEIIAIFRSHFSGKNSFESLRNVTLMFHMQEACFLVEKGKFLQKIMNFTFEKFDTFSKIFP